MSWREAKEARRQDWAVLLGLTQKGSLTLSEG